MSWFDTTVCFGLSLLVLLLPENHTVSTLLFIHTKHSDTAAWSKHAVSVETLGCFPVNAIIVH